MSGCQATLSYKRNAHGGGCEHKKETLEMRASYIKLQKELERSEQRDVALTRELLATRSTMQDSQRDLHTFKTVFEKTNAERKHLANQLHEQKEYNSKLEIQITRMDQSCQLIIDLDASQTENKRLLNELEKQDAIVQSVRDKEQAQLREIEALNRSLDACVFYQGGKHLRDAGGGTGSGAGAVSGEKLREIYYELGKRQTDIHALSLSLSQVTACHKELEQCHKDLERAQSTAQVEIKHVKEYNDQLLQKSISTAKEMSALEKETDGLRECNRQLQGDISTLMDKLKTSMLGATEREESNEEHISSLNSTIADLQEAKHHLTERLEALTLSLRHRESVLALTEKRLEVESQRLQEDRQHLEESTRQGEAHSSQIQMLRSNMTNALHANELLARESREVSEGHRQAQEVLQQRCMRAEALSQTQTDQLRQRDEQLHEMAGEREEMVAAFKKSIGAAKGLSTRLVHEQAVCLNLKQQLQHTEQSMQQIIKAKEQVSYAVLDALYKERSQHSHAGGNAEGGDASHSYSHHEESPRPHSTHMHPQHHHSDPTDHTPTSRPPLKHPLVNSTGANDSNQRLYKDANNNVSFAAPSPSASSQQSYVHEQQRHHPPQPQQQQSGDHLLPSHSSRGEAAHGHGHVHVHRVWDSAGARQEEEGDEDEDPSGEMQDDDFLNDSLDKPIGESGIIFEKNDLAGDLKRLRREVEVLEMKARQSASSSTNDREEGSGGSRTSTPPSPSLSSRSYSTEHEDDLQTSSVLNSTARSSSPPSLGVTSSMSLSDTDKRRTHSPPPLQTHTLTETQTHTQTRTQTQTRQADTPPRPSHHSLFDLVDLDPRVAFEHSQPSSPADRKSNSTNNHKKRLEECSSE